jgi:hypothetical protein
MSGIEILGAIGFVVTLLEVAVASGSYVECIIKYSSEKVAINEDFPALEQLRERLKQFVDSQPQPSPASGIRAQSFQSTLETAITGIETCVNGLKIAVDCSSRFKWKFDKVKIKQLLQKLHGVKELILLTLTVETA